MRNSYELDYGPFWTITWPRGEFVLALMVAVLFSGILWAVL